MECQEWSHRMEIKNKKSWIISAFLDMSSTKKKNAKLVQFCIWKKTFTQSRVKIEHNYKNFPSYVDALYGYTLWPTVSLLCVYKR